MSTHLPIRLVDPRGQRFGAGLSATMLFVAVLAEATWLAAVVGVALTISAALGTRWFVFGRPWPLVRNLLRLGPPHSVEPELGPRFAQVLGATFVFGGFVLVALGVSAGGWLPILGVAALQTLLATTGYCLGCRLYGLHWFLPALFDRAAGGRAGPAT